jgi:hypothetical protein
VPAPCYLFNTTDSSDHSEHIDNDQLALASTSRGPGIEAELRFRTECHPASPECGGHGVVDRELLVPARTGLEALTQVSKSIWAH